jgi:hypothetical protein
VQSRRGGEQGVAFARTQEFPILTGSPPVTLE